MLATVQSSAVMGIDAYVVQVEIDIADGLPAFNTVGLPDSAVKESRERVAAAIKNSGFYFPTTRITANLAPADVRKEGSAFDLPIALGVLTATAQIRSDHFDRTLVLGELALDGKHPFGAGLSSDRDQREREGVHGRHYSQSEREGSGNRRRVEYLPCGIVAGGGSIPERRKNYRAVQIRYLGGVSAALGVHD